MSGDRTVIWDPEFARVETGSVAREAGAVAGSVIAGRYRLTRLLGAGGMGDVWLAQDRVLRRSVALKRVVDRDGEGGLNALREARSAARVTHPGVVEVHDVLLEEDGTWIVMEALPGQPLTIGELRSRAPRSTAHAGRRDAVLDGLLERDPTRRLDVAGARSQLQAVEPIQILARAG